jgi:ferritin
MESRVSKKIHDMINAQIGHEQTNSLLYLAMSNWANFEGWQGVAELYKKYSDEEAGHRDIFIKYLLDRNALPATPSKTDMVIPADFAGIAEIISATLKREIETTEAIKKISYAAMEDKDCVTGDFLIEMILEQRSEESDAMYWSDRLDLYKSTNSPLIMFDKEMGDKAK